LGIGCAVIDDDNLILDLPVGWQQHAIRVGRYRAQNIEAACKLQGRSFGAARRSREARGNIANRTAPDKLTLSLCVALGTRESRHCRFLLCCPKLRTRKQKLMKVTRKHQITDMMINVEIGYKPNIATAFTPTAAECVILTPPCPLMRTMIEQVEKWRDWRTV
jgi:hypothetical protein